MDPNALAAARAGKPMLPQQQPPPNRYSMSQYYPHPSQMSYQHQSQVPQSLPPHRSLSQGPTPNYSMPSTPMPSNGTSGKPILLDATESKSDDIIDESAKQQQQLQQQQQQMFHPLLQSRSRPQTPSFYPNMAPNNSSYYSSQRPMTPTPDYSMAMARGMRPATAPYGSVPMQQRMRAPYPGQLPSSMGDPSMSGMNTNPMGLQSTPPPPSVTPR